MDLPLQGPHAWQCGHPRGGVPVGLLPGRRDRLSPPDGGLTRRPAPEQALRRFCYLLDDVGVLVSEPGRAAWLARRRRAFEAFEKVVTTRSTDGGGSCLGRVSVGL